MEIRLAANDTSIEQWKAAHGDHAELEKKFSVKEKELTDLLELVSQQLAARDEDLAKVQRQVQELNSNLLTSKHQIRQLMLQERCKFLTASPLLTIFSLIVQLIVNSLLFCQRSQSVP